ncbi:ABC transporter permease subunit [Halomarina halobia]|uniref:ABC transporter permease subunit n=1 Tax=Halomarina halobia TaxID=3033386 RepID=A0ABD6A862_9EURY|nr:ABC transporter permease subunit [Halomarina sp. PSR21]
MTGRWLGVARKDFRDAIRSRTLLSLTVLFVLFVAGASFLFVEVLPLPLNSTGVLLTSLLTPTSVLVPLIGLLVGYRAVVGERESGSLKLLLSLPYTRGDVLFGKLVGRAGVVFVSVVVGFLTGAVAVLALLRGFDPSVYLAFLAVTLLYALAFVAIGVGISAATASTTRAAVVAFGAFVLFQFLWGPLNDLLVYAVDGTFPAFGAATAPDWSQFLRRLNPQEAYGAAARVAIGTANRAAEPGSQPLYLRDELGLPILALWVVVPLALGYRRFRRADLT